MWWLIKNQRMLDNSNIFYLNRGMKILKKFFIITASIGLFFGALNQESKATFLNAGTEVTQLAHTGINTGGWINDAANWAQQRVDELNKLTQLITNNVFTEAIRGFNELMTAIQTDISEVLGTVASLMDAPLSLFGSLIDIPMSIWGQLEGLMGVADPFKNVYGQAMNMFSMVGNAQGIGQDIGGLQGLFQGGGSSGFNSAYDFNNKVSGIVTKLNSDFLAPSNAQKRAQTYRGWIDDSDAALFGGDAIQIQAMQSRQLTHISEALNRSQEFDSLNTLRERARELSLWEQAKARASGTYNATSLHIGSGLSQ